MAHPTDPTAQAHGYHPQMMMPNQNGGNPAAVLNWVPPPGWVAPPGWAEYQAFVAAATQQHRGSQQYHYPPAQAGAVPPMGYGYPQQGVAHLQVNPNLPPQHAPGAVPSPRNTQLSPHGHVPQQPLPSPRGSQQQAYAQMYPGYAPQQYAYPPQQYPSYQHPAGHAVPPHAAHPNQHVAGHPAHRPSLPTPEVLPNIPPPASAHHQQHPPTARPPPPEPAHTQQRPARVKVKFEDADSDEEELSRHDTLGHFDVEDVHELSERDFAELDTGKESNVQDAGIIEGGIAVQPAIPLKDTASRESTLPAVESFIVPVPPRRASGYVPPPAAPSTDIPAEPPATTEVAPAPASETPEKPQSPSRRNSEAGGTMGKRRSTFGAVLLGAAAAMFSGSSKKLASSRQGSMIGTSPNKDTTDAAAAAGIAALTVSSSASSSLPTPPSSSASTPAATEESEPLPDPPQLKSSPSTPQQPEPEPAATEVVVTQEPVPSQLTPEVSEVSPSPNPPQSEAPPATASTAAATTTSEASSNGNAASSAAASAHPQPSPGGFLGPVMNQEADDSEVVSIKVRTLAGKAAIFEVDKLMSLFELRQLIQEHFNNIPFEEQRLLYKGKMIEILDPSTTLEEIGFKDNDLIHLVRTLGGQSAKDQPSPTVPPKPLPETPPSAPAGPSSVSSTSSPERQAPAPQQNLQMLTVLVPPGRGPGDRLRILPQGRGAMLVTVPAGVFAGDRFRVLLPPEDPAELARAEALLQQEQMRQQEFLRQQEMQRQQEMLQQQQQTRPQIMAVVVPKGFKAGQMMDVNVPGKGRVRVTIPNGVKAGQQFKFRLPN